MITKFDLWTLIAALLFFSIFGVVHYNEACHRLSTKIVQIDSLTQSSLALHDTLDQTIRKCDMLWDGMLTGEKIVLSSVQVPSAQKKELELLYESSRMNYEEWRKLQNPQIFGYK